MSSALFEKPKIQIAGENALIIYFAEHADSEVAVRVQHAVQAIRTKLTNDIIDLIPSYASILVVFNQLDIDHHQLRNKLRAVLSHLTEGKLIKGEIIELPVYYSTESGPDLALIAQQANLSIEQVIELHQAKEYRVYAIGFAPGFAYLGEVDKRIAMPRLSTPRLKVPQGAVAIADRQTAVYPSESPGGWNIIGNCPVKMFDAAVTDPKASMPVQVGDKVKFKAISKQEFLTLGGVFSSELGQGV
jgi:KipI family sensor histidine kinase inhibitor